MVMQEENGLNTSPNMFDGNESSHFYQKLATNLKNDSNSSKKCSYFDTLQHQAGIQSTRKNGYYIKNNENVENQEHNESKAQNDASVESTKNGEDKDFEFDFQMPFIPDQEEQSFDQPIEPQITPQNNHKVANDFHIANNNGKISNNIQGNVQHTQQNGNINSVASNQTYNFANSTKQNVVQPLNALKQKDKFEDIDDIFAFDEDSGVNNTQNEQTPAPLLQENDFYNDYFVADEMIDEQPENKQQYAQAIQQARDNPMYFNNPVLQNVSQNIRVASDKIATYDSLIDENENKKKIIVASLGSICFLSLLLFVVLLVTYINGEKSAYADSDLLLFEENINDNGGKNSIKEMPHEVEQVLEDENIILAVPLKEIYAYDENLENMIGIKEKLTLVIAYKSNIKDGFIGTNTGYMNAADLYEYPKTQEEFYNESIAYFQNYEQEHQSLKDLLGIEDNTILGEIQNKEQKDKYTIFYDMDNKVSLLGDLGEKLASKNNGVDYSSSTNSLIIELANGQSYGRLRIENADIDADLCYGMSQANIDRYDTCSSESFGIPGGNKPILIGGHNTNSLKNLTNVQIGDIITVETTYGTFKYQIYYTGIGHVVTENTLVSDYLKDVENEEEIFSINEDGEVLGIYTCYDYPEQKEQPTPYRFAVKARRISGVLSNKYFDYFQNQ